MIGNTNLQITLASRPVGYPAPEAFIGMMNGRSFGKLLIKVSDE